MCLYVPILCLYFLFLCSFAGAAVTVGRRGQLKQQKITLSQLWRPEVQGQGVSGVGSFWKLWALPARLLCPAPWRLICPWAHVAYADLILASGVLPLGLLLTQSLAFLGFCCISHLCLHPHDLLPVCVCVCLQTAPFYKGHPLIGLGPTLRIHQGLNPRYLHWEADCL